MPNETTPQALPADALPSAILSRRVAEQAAEAVAAVERAERAKLEAAAEVEARRNAALLAEQAEQEALRRLEAARAARAAAVADQTRAAQASTKAGAAVETARQEARRYAERHRTQVAAAEREAAEYAARQAKAEEASRRLAAAAAARTASARQDRAEDRRADRAAAASNRERALAALAPGVPGYGWAFARHAATAICEKLELSRPDAVPALAYALAFGRTNWCQPRPSTRKRAWQLTALTLEAMAGIIEHQDCKRLHVCPDFLSALVAQNPTVASRLERAGAVAKRALSARHAKAKEEEASPPPETPHDLVPVGRLPALAYVAARRTLRLPQDSPRWAVGTQILALLVARTRDTDESWFALPLRSLADAGYTESPGAAREVLDALVRTEALRRRWDDSDKAYQYAMTVEQRARVEGCYAELSVERAA